MTLQDYPLRAGCCFALILLGAFIESTRADLLCEELMKTNLPGIYSNEKGQEVAVPFFLSQQASITHLTWCGFWWGPEAASRQAAETLTQFSLRVFPDSSDGPGAVPMLDQTIRVQVQPTGQTMHLSNASGYDGNPVYRFDADIAPATPVGPGTNWLSIIALHPTADQWLWSRSRMGPSGLRIRVLSRGPQWTAIPQQGMTAFAIQGNTVTNR